jgi:hypothetical protein
MTKSDFCVTFECTANGRRKCHFLAKKKPQSSYLYLQLRTSKVDNFIIGSGNFFGIKPSAGMDSEGQITSKTGVV